MRSWRFTCSDTSANNVRPANLLVSPLIVSIRNAGCCVEAGCGASAQLQLGALPVHPEVVGLMRIGGAQGAPPPSQTGRTDLPHPPFRPQALDGLAQPSF